MTLGTVNIIFTMIILYCILLCSGDIELNPGPKSYSVCKKINICHINIRSLSRSKLRALQTSIANGYDIITLSETHLHQGVSNNVFNLTGFHEIIRKDRNEHGGGVAIYIKENIAYKRLAQYESKNMESLWVQINTIQGKVLICCCYRPPDKKADFWNTFEDSLIESKSDKAKYMVVLGDLNADFKTPNGRKLSDICARQNLSCLIKEPTRITKTTATILDQIITNAPNFVGKVNIIPPVSTNDHCTVSAWLNFKVPCEQAYDRIIWQYKNANFDNYRLALEAADFDLCFETDDVDEVCKKWTETVINTARESIPNKVVKIRPNDSPWYGPDLRALKRKVQRLFQRHKRTKIDAHYDKYSEIRNNYQRQLDMAETKYLKSLSSSLADTKNTSSWWKTVKWLLGKGGDRTYPAMRVNGKDITDNKTKANEFNSFFSSHSNIDISNAQLPDEGNFPLNIREVIAEEKDVYDLLKSIDTSKATGPDGLSPKMLYEAGASLVPSLTRLINLSLSKSKVPSQWKQANVIPLFKKGEQNDINNYRPVSLLPCVSKILEKIIFKTVFNYIRDNELLSKHQSGFQPGDSTVHQLSYLYHIFCEALDFKKDVKIVFCDISKAFDRVWHDGLIYKLKKLGIYGNLIEWFKDYLHERTQRVVIRGQTSEPNIIKGGVPQGSVLGPLLFLVYINDLTDIVNSKVKLFADDTSLYIDFDDAETAVENLNGDLENISQWAKQWLVNFSPAKTKAMTCTFKETVTPPVYFNNVAVSEVSSHKHLGLSISSDLSWTVHIKNIVENVSSMSAVLKKLKYDVDRKSLEKNYFTFIRPKLEYASHIWDNCSTKDSEFLESIQLDIMRTVTGARKGTSHALLYEECNWETLSKRREINKMKHFAKLTTGNAPKYLTDLVPEKIGVSRPCSRQAENYKSIKTRTETYKQSYIPSSIGLWNKLESQNRNLDYIISLNTEPNKKSTNKLFYEGERLESMKHSQLRMKCSKLNSHLFELHVADIDSPGCACGYNCEDTNHFLLNCPLYYINRRKMLYDLNKIIDIQINIDILLYGCDEVDFKKNCSIFKCVQQFIKESDRL